MDGEDVEPIARVVRRQAYIGRKNKSERKGAGQIARRIQHMDLSDESDTEPK